MDIIQTEDARIYRITLVIVAEAESDGYKPTPPLEQIQEALSYSSNLTVIGSEQQLLMLVENTHAPFVDSTSTQKIVGVPIYLPAKTAPKSSTSKGKKRRISASATSSFQRWSDDEKLLALTLAEQGVLVAEIARQLHRSSAAVYNVVWKFNKEKEG